MNILNEAIKAKEAIEQVTSSNTERPSREKVRGQLAVALASVQSIINHESQFVNLTTSEPATESDLSVGVGN